MSIPRCDPGVNTSLCDMNMLHRDPNVHASLIRRCTMIASVFFCCAGDAGGGEQFGTTLSTQIEGLFGNGCAEWLSNRRVAID